MNFFKLYIGDYQRDTAHLSVTEHGAYLLMLQHYYATEKPLPSGKALHRMLRAQDKAEREAIDAVVALFWTQTPEGLVNERADAEIAKAATQADTNRRIAVQREERRKAARNTHEPSTNRATNGEPSHSHSHSQTPEKIKTPEAARSTPYPLPEPTSADARAAPRAESEQASARRGLMAKLLREEGVLVTPSHPTVVQWSLDGVTDAQLRESLEVARLRKPRPETIPIAYLAPILRELRERPVDAGGARERDWDRIFGTSQETAA